MADAGFRQFFNRRMKWEIGAAVSGVIYLLQQDFTNGSGATPGAPTYGGSWTNSVGTWVFNNTSPALPQGGNNAKGGPDFGGGICYGTFTSGNPRYGYFEFQLSAIPGGTLKLYKLQDSGGTDKVWISILSDGRLAVFNSDFEGYATVGTISANTNYQVWMTYLGGTSMNVSFSTDGTRPTSGDNFASGACSVNAAVERCSLQYSDGNIMCYFDHILVNDTQIGNNP
jgi:hypothetical protein